MLRQQERWAAMHTCGDPPKHKTTSDATTPGTARDLGCPDHLQGAAIVQPMVPIKCKSWTMLPALVKGQVVGVHSLNSVFPHLVSTNFSKVKYWTHQIPIKNATLSQHTVWIGNIWTFRLVSCYPESCVTNMYRNTFFQQRNSIYIMHCIVFSKLWWFMFVKFKLPA